MSSTYYFAAWTDRGCLLGCSHKHQTVGEAASCIAYAGGYVVGVENGRLRALTHDEEAQFQRAICTVPISTPAAKSLQYVTSGYAVMVRVKCADQWAWTTWMRFDTYEQAAAHAKEGNKIVPFGSAEWTALCSSAEAALPDSAAEPREGQTYRPEKERLVEFVLRFLQSEFDDHYLTDRERALPASSEPGTESDTLVDIVLQWINEWEVRVLERIYSLQTPERIEALRSRIREALKRC